MLIIMSLKRYKEKYKLKNFSHRITVNMTLNGFGEIFQDYLDKGEKCQAIAEKCAKDMKIVSGTLVWYRSRKWATPVMVLFGKNIKQHNYIEKEYRATNSETSFGGFGHEIIEV